MQLRQAVPVDQIRIDRPHHEAAVWLTHAACCSLVAWLVAILIRNAPLPLFDDAFTHDAWYAIGFKLGWMLLVPVLWLTSRGYRPRDLLAGWSLSISSALALGVALSVGTGINAGHLGPIQHLARETPPAELALALSAGTLVPLLTAALPEELAFRALLQTRLEAVTGRLVAIGTTALLFTAWHLPSRYLLADGVEGSAGDLGSVLIGTGLPVLIVGLVFGILWDRHRSLPVLIVLHWGIDLLPAIRHALGGHF